MDYLFGESILPNLMNASNLNVKITSNDKLDCEYAYQLKIIFVIWLRIYQLIKNFKI